MVTDVASGTLVLNADGSFTYTPALNFFGEVTFTYRAFDGHKYSDPVTVTITVAPVNDSPVAEDDLYETGENVQLVVPTPGVLDNDSDPDPGDMFTVVLMTPTQHGTVELQANGSFVYTPAPGFSGTDTAIVGSFAGIDHLIGTSLTGSSGEQLHGRRLVLAQGLAGLNLIHDVDLLRFLAGAPIDSTGSVRRYPRPGTVAIAAGPMTLRRAITCACRLFSSTTSFGHTVSISSRFPTTRSCRSSSATSVSNARPPSFTGTPSASSARSVGRAS